MSFLDQLSNQAPEQLRDLIQSSPYGILIVSALIILVVLLFWIFLRRAKISARHRDQDLNDRKKATKDLPTRSSGVSVESLTTDRVDRIDELTESDILPGRQEVLVEVEQVELAKALSKTRDSFWGRMKSVLGLAPTLSSDDVESIEEVLYTSDLGPKTVSRLMTAVHKAAKQDSKSGVEGFRLLLKAEMLEIFKPVQGTPGEDPSLLTEEATVSQPVNLAQQFNITNNPSVWMMVGINGAGKTTTIGKLATLLAEMDKKVLLAAGDTFRAAAGQQLKVWTERAQVEIFNPPDVTDPSAVAFDAIQKAKAKNFDVVIIDTAGRLHTQKNLMEELKKMKRVLSKVMPEAPHETLLVLDANQGQNALLQAREFHEALNVTGIVLTKLDGTAKGGVALGVANELNIPIKLIGVGEKPRDLRPFSAEEYVNSILGL